MSPQTGSRVQAFRDAVRSRDRRCVITGEEVIADYWRGFEAAHIFPLAYEQYWTDHNYGRWISVTPDRGGTINSIQNGLLLRSDMHQLFDFYEFSINPDVCIYLYFCRNIVANYYFRTITRLYALYLIARVLLEDILTKDFSIIPNGRLIRFYVGILGRLFLLI